MRTYLLLFGLTAALLSAYAVSRSFFDDPLTRELQAAVNELVKFGEQLSEIEPNNESFSDFNDDIGRLKRDLMRRNADRNARNLPRRERIALLKTQAEKRLDSFDSILGPNNSVIWIRFWIIRPETVEDAEFDNVYSDIGRESDDFIYMNLPESLFKLLDIRVEITTSIG